MIQTEAFFSDTIRPVLLRELGLARQSIHVAVAWFTDPALFAALLARQRAGVAVALAVTDDEINFRPGGLPFGELAAAGGQFFRVSGALMHHKFCVLDGRDLVTGSYNWTYRAATANQENIVLTTGDDALAQRFIGEFRVLTGQVPAAGGGADPGLGRAAKRAERIRLDIQLEETDDLAKQADRLAADSPDPRVQGVAAALRAGRLADAVTRIEELLQTLRTVQVWDDPRVAALRLEIRLLETEVVALENEHLDASRVLTMFHQRFTRELGALLEAILHLKTELAARARQQSAFAEAEYQQAQSRYDEQRRQRAASEAEAAQTIELDPATRADLKRAYREASLLCHPDRVAEADRPAATAAFQKLQAAYQRQDIAAVQAQLHELRRGLFATDDVARTDLAALTAQRDRLRRHQADLLAALAALRAAEAYALGRDEAAAAAYLATTKTQLEAELTRLQQLYEQSA